MSEKTADAKLIVELCNTEWIQDWSGMYTPLIASLDNQPGNEAYFTVFEKYFGRHISSVLIVFDGEHATAWKPLRDYEELGTYLAQKACDPEFLAKWLKDYEETFAKLIVLVRLPEEEFMQRFEEFYKVYPTFAPIVIAAKDAYDFLPLDKDDVAQKLRSTREKTEQFYSLSHALINRITISVAERLGYSAEEVRAMTVQEFALYCREGMATAQKELNDRLSVKGLLMRKGLHQPLSADDVQEIQKAWQVDIALSEVKGTVAYQGKMRGKVRMIKDYRGASIEDGEILVTVMTDPSYVPLMKKAGAIVTDAGGLLCHAAIVARELKKPCIVGTKAATQIFKDGDMVEVDAEKGLVRRIA